MVHKRLLDLIWQFYGVQASLRLQHQQEQSHTARPLQVCGFECLHHLEALTVFINNCLALVLSNCMLSLADKDNLVTQLVIHHLYNRLVSFASWELIFSAEKLYNFTRHFFTHHISFYFFCGVQC